MITRKLTYFSHKFDTLMRFMAIWTAGSMAGYVWISLMAPSVSKLVAILLTTIPSVSLGWVFAKSSIKVLEQTQRNWVRHTLATGTICFFSTAVVVMSLWWSAGIL